MTREPSRTCVGCRQVRSRRALVRLVRGRDGVVIADPRGTAAGRGAYVCPDEVCLERALQRGRLGHAFRKPCELEKDLAMVVRAAGRATAEASGEMDREVVRAAGRATAEASGEMDRRR